MRGWLSVALLLGLLAPSATLAQTDSDEESVERPVFTLGDWWLYRLKGDIYGTANSTVARRENITVNGTTFDVWRITADVNAAQIRTPAFPNGFVEDKWVRVADHARVRTHAESEDAIQTTSYVPPQTEIAYPFKDESTWRSFSNVTLEEQRSVFGIGRPDPEGPVRYHQERVDGKVIGKVRLTTVAGEFIAFLIEYASHSAEGERFFRWYYAPEVCTNVLEEYYDSETDVQPQIVYELTEYRCTQPAEPLAETPDVKETIPPPSWGPPDDVPPAKNADKKDGNWLPGFGISWLVPAVVAAVLLAGRHPRKE